jgi:uncharacterized membrane protein YGL010W
MFYGTSWAAWISEYSKSHEHPANKFCHAVGIPLIALSLPLAVASLFVDGLWMVALGGFVVGWALQFIGHLFEGKPPEFFRDWRFLLVGPRWWIAKISRRG